jgi:hypothetical protein
VELQSHSIEMTLMSIQKKLRSHKKLQTLKLKSISLQPNLIRIIIHPKLKENI